MEGNAGTKAQGSVQLIISGDASYKGMTINQPIVVSDQTGKLLFQQIDRGRRTGVVEGDQDLGEDWTALWIDVEAVEEGQQYNLPAGSITQLVNNPGVFTEVIQREAIQGGADYSVEVLSVSAEAQKNMKTVTKEVGDDLERIEADLERLKRTYDTVRPDLQMPVMWKQAQGLHPIAGDFQVRRIQDGDDSDARRLSDEWDFLSLAKLRALGISKTLLGQSGYGRRPAHDDRPNYQRGFSPPNQYEVSGIIVPAELPKRTVEQEQEDLVAQIRERMERGE